MLHSIGRLNYIAVFVVAIAGFMLGWLWYSPVLFAKPWMKEMKITRESMQSMSKGQGARLLIMGFVYTLLSTFALAVLMRVHGNMGVVNGALYGFFVGALLVSARKLNTDLWAGASLRLQAINVGYELALFIIQGAILGIWR
jgi:hypothetical protein